jgi:hypothetical protein
VDAAQVSLVCGCGPSVVSSSRLAVDRGDRHGAQHAGTTGGNSAWNAAKSDASSVK